MDGWMAGEWKGQTEEWKDRWIDVWMVDEWVDD